MRIVCPSGFSGQARKLRGSELQTMADRIEEDSTISDGGTTIAPLLSGVWLETTDPGPYSFMTASDTTTPDWLRMVKADVIGALFQVRVGSFRDGHLYTFTTQCPACKKRYDCDIDMQKVILDKANPIPETTLEALKSGAALSAKLVDGRAVKFRLTTMGDDIAHAKIRKQLVRRKERANDTTNIIDQLAMMIVSVEGLTQLDPIRAWKWARDLELDDLYSLIDQFDAQSGGYDTMIDARCPHCKHLQEIDLPLGRSFLDPRKRSDRSEKQMEMEGTVPEERKTNAKTTTSSASQGEGEADA
jgi:phage FluMu protein Com